MQSYVDHMKLELYGRGETLVTVGAGAEGDNGDGLTKDECDASVKVFFSVKNFQKFKQKFSIFSFLEKKVVSTKNKLYNSPWKK